MAVAQPIKQAHSIVPHMHAVGEVCPTCDQPIPHDRFDEVKERIETRQRERSEAIVAPLREQFDRDKAAALETAGREAAAVLEAKVADAREEARCAAEQAAHGQVAAADAARVVAEQAGNVLRGQLEQTLRDNAAAIAKVKEDAVAKEAEIRVTAAETAEAAVRDKVALLERGRQESEAALRARAEQAEGASAAFKEKLEQAARDNYATVEKIKADSTAREEEIRRSAAAAAEAALQDKISASETTRVDAESRAAAAEQLAAVQKQTHETDLSQRLQEQRDALEKAKIDAVNAEKSAAFEEKLKLSGKVEELQRTLDKKTAEELGEGAELEIFELLKAEFDSDRIERINKGQPGADILHTVIHNGKECGKIIYDSKNHNAWRNDFVDKLASDQMAAKAEHAILSTRKFPAGTRHLHIQDGVMLASPSRVVALVQIVRQHLVQTYTLRLSNQERTQKTAALYRFITSERCVDLFSRIDKHAEDLLEMQVKEKRTHEATWKRQGEVIRSVQRVRAELCGEIDTIIGTAESSEKVRE